MDLFHMCLRVIILHIFNMIYNIDFRLQFIVAKFDWYCNDDYF